MVPVFKNLKFQVLSGIGHLTINRPQVLNVLNSETFSEMEELFLKLKENKQALRVLFIQGGGDKAFVAGADVKEIASFTVKEAEEFSRKGQKVFSSIEDLPFPVIALVKGFALGGGLELALACDFVVLSEKARVGLPEVGLGLLPAFGGTQRLCRSIGWLRAKEMIFSGRLYTAEEALQMGLVSWVVPHKKLQSKAMELAQLIQSRGPLALARAKKLFYSTQSLSFEEGLQKESSEFAGLLEQEEAKEGMKAFLEKRKPQFGK